MLHCGRICSDNLKKPISNHRFQSSYETTFIIMKIVVNDLYYLSDIVYEIESIL